jgi:hypothetical protein
LSILQGNSCSIDQKNGGIWTVQTDLQQIYPKSDRLLEGRRKCERSNEWQMQKIHWLSRGGNSLPG